jgi:hypothetical protein
MRGGGHGGEGHGGIGHSGESHSGESHSGEGHNPASNSPGPGARGADVGGQKGDHSEKADASGKHEPSAISRAAAEAYSPGLEGRIAKREAHREAHLEEHIEEVASRSFTSQLAGAAKLGISLKNNDCGPSSLATAMKALGVMSLSGSYESQISSVREQMTGMDNHMQGTTVGQVASTAEAHGLKAAPVGGLRAIDKALAQHAVVVEGGQPTHVVGGVNFQGNQTNKVNAIGHFVTVLGYNPVAKTYTVDNSERPGPTEVSRAQMRAFVTRPDGGFYAGVALSRSRPAPSETPGQPLGPSGLRSPENAGVNAPRGAMSGGNADFELKFP